MLRILLLIFVFASCGQKAGTPSRIEVSLGGVTAEQASVGGFAVRAISDLGDVLDFTVSSSSPVVVVPNGAWSFHIAIYEGPSAWSGTIRCGSSDLLKLGGVETAVAITVLQTTCAQSPFPAILAARNPTAVWDTGIWDTGKWGP